MHPRPRPLACALAVLVAAFSLLAPAPAHAIDLSATPVSTIGAKGKVVYDLVVLPSGRTVIGGDFPAMGKWSRSNLGAVLADGSIDPYFAPTTNGPVRALALSEDGSTIFVGGRFTEVNGAPRHNLAAIDAVSGTLLEDWRADTTGDNPVVRALYVHGNHLYVGGKFTGIDGKGKKKLARLDATTGDLTKWDTWVGAGVLDFAADPDGTTMWVGGEFKKIRGVARPYFGGIDMTTGLPTEFAATGNNSRVLSLVVSDDGWVYTTNNDNRTIGYRPQESPDPQWRRRTDGNVQSLAVIDGDLYLGGHFARMTDTGAGRPFFAAVNRFTGMDRPWHPLATGANKGCWVLVPEGQRLHAGGGFVKFAGVPQKRYARFDPVPAG